MSQHHAPILYNLNNTPIYPITNETQQIGTYKTTYTFPITQNIQGAEEIDIGFEQGRQFGFPAQCVLQRDVLGEATASYIDALFARNSAEIHRLEERPRSRQITGNDYPQVNPYTGQLVPTGRPTINPAEETVAVNEDTGYGTLRGLFGVSVVFVPLIQRADGVLTPLQDAQELMFAEPEDIDQQIQAQREDSSLGNTWEMAADKLEILLHQKLEYRAYGLKESMNGMGMESFVIFQSVILSYFTYTDLWLAGLGVSPYTVSKLPFLLSQYAIIQRDTRENCLWVSVAIASALNRAKPTKTQMRLLTDEKACLQAGYDLKRAVPLPAHRKTVEECNKEEVRELLERLAVHKKTVLVVVDGSFCILGAWNEEHGNSYTRIMLHDRHYMAIVDREKVPADILSVLELEKPSHTSEGLDALTRIIRGVPSMSQAPLPGYETPEQTLSRSTDILPYEFRDTQSECDVKNIVGAPMAIKNIRQEKKKILLCTYDLETMARPIESVDRVWESDVLAIPQQNIKIGACSRTVIDQRSDADKKCVIQDAYAIGMAAVELADSEDESKLYGFDLGEGYVEIDTKPGECAYPNLMRYANGRLHRISSRSWFGLKDPKKGKNGCLADWLQYMHTQIDRLDGCEVYLYAHNGSGFDIMFILRELLIERDLDSDMPWEVMLSDCMELNSKFIKVVLRHKQHTKVKLHFMDSMCLLPGSLEKLAKSFSVKHLKDTFDHSTVRPDNVQDLWENSNLQRYLQHDVLSLLEILLKFGESVADSYQLPLWQSLTAASLAKAVFLSKFYDPNHRLFYGAKEISEVLRSGYFGGRVELFQRGVIKGPLHYYDMTSMYPSMLLAHPSPVGKPRYVEGEQLLDHKTGLLKKDFFGFVACRVRHDPDVIAKYNQKTERDYLPLHAFVHNKSLVVPLFEQEHQMLLFSEEIKYAQTKGLGYMYTYDYGIAFKPQRGVFTPYINSVFEQKKQAKKCGDSAKQALSKLLLNSLYGVFGLKVQDRDSILLTPPHSLDWQQYASSGRLMSVAYHKGCTALRCYRDIESRSVQVAISSACTSYSRMCLHEFMQDTMQMLGARLVYCDTDSCVFEGAKIHPLDSREFFGKHITETYGADLGTWKSEYADVAPDHMSAEEKRREAFTQGIFVAPKVYALETGDANTAPLLKAKGYSQKQQGLEVDQYRNTIEKSDELDMILGKRKRGEYTDDQVWDKTKGRFIAQRVFTMSAAKASFVSPQVSAFHLNVTDETLKVLGGRYTKRTCETGSGWCAPLRL